MNDQEVTKIAVLRNIFDKNGRIASYSLYKKLKIPMADFMKTIFELESSKSVNFDGDWLEITEVGRQFLIQSRPKNDHMLRRGIPSGILRNFRLVPGEPYIPSISRLDLSLRQKLLCVNVPDEGA